MMMIAVGLLAVALSAGVHAQFPPKPQGVTTIQSRFHKDVTISYKEPGICETTPGVKSYSGYVHLPPNFLLGDWEDRQDYPINTFFWFFEARKDPANAPLSIWLNGGPGGSSMMGLLQENGPCFVGRDSNSTYLNPYSWNNEVNMLYIDQPVQVGFSYDVPTNCTKDLNMDENSEEGEPVLAAPFKGKVPPQNNTFLVGTMGSQKMKSTVNSTAHAAHAIWHFAQTWFEEFPFYKPEDEKISLWTESYGGKYGPGFASFFEEQNDKIANGTITTPGAHYIHMDTLGIVNGGFDFSILTPSYAEFAYNNTYGIQAFDKETYDSAVQSWEKPGGGRDKYDKCKKLSEEKDPRNLGNNEEVNEACIAAMNSTEQTAIFPYIGSRNHAFYDIAHPAADPFPEPWLHGFLNQHWVQAALGVPVNYSAASEAVGLAFGADIGRSQSLTQLTKILEKGVKVALVYGDRDFVCNWVSGETSSLLVDYAGSADFASAGYAPILSGSNLAVGGQVRQYGNFSFSRVYQAGHEVPSYQPEVSYDLFMRALFNKDMSTGLIPLFDSYKTTGPDSTWHIKNEIPERPEPVCYILVPVTCTKEQYERVLDGTAIIENWIVVGVSGDAQRSSGFGDVGDAQEYVGKVDL